MGCLGKIGEFFEIHRHMYGGISLYIPIYIEILSPVSTVMYYGLRNWCKLCRLKLQ